MVPRVVRLLAYLHQYMEHARTRLREPAVPRVELIAEYQADFLSAVWLLLLRHRSLQYFTTSQSFRHFFRHWKGREHAAQVLMARREGGR